MRHCVMTRGALAGAVVKGWATGAVAEQASAAGRKPHLRRQAPALQVSSGPPGDPARATARPPHLRLSWRRRAARLLMWQRTTRSHCAPRQLLTWKAVQQLWPPHLRMSCWRMAKPPAKRQKMPNLSAAASPASSACQQARTAWPAGSMQPHVCSSSRRAPAQAHAAAARVLRTATRSRGTPMSPIPRRRRAPRSWQNSGCCWQAQASRASGSPGSPGRAAGQQVRLRMMQPPSGR